MSFIFIDTETTGLNPYDPTEPDRILEFGIASYNDRLKVQWSKQWLVGDLETDARFSKELDDEDSFIGKMHRKSGLATEWMAAYGTPRMVRAEDLTDEVCSLLTAVGLDLDNMRTVPICGSSVHFDRMFMRRWIPELDAKFSYRIIDVSSFKETLRVVWPTGYEQLVKDEEQNPSLHRVLNDIQDSVNLFRKCLAFWEDMYVPLREQLS